MKSEDHTIYIGVTPQAPTEKEVTGETINLFGEPFYKIQNFDGIEPFFMTIVSSSDHWLFISSTGGLSAGRVSAEQAIFPYYTVDKITDNSENTGSKTILLVKRSARMNLWEPFSDRQHGNYAIERNLYKNATGTALIFEENNLDLGLTFRYAWRTSEKYGFVKTSWLINQIDSPCQVEVLDGLQNILPANISSLTQNTFSTLLDAYKRSELNCETGLAIFTLNSQLTDLAEPSESLKATTVYQVGLDSADYLLSSQQLDLFRSGKAVISETEVRGRRGAYFVHTQLDLLVEQEHSWHLLVDVSQDSAAIAQKIQWLHGGQPSKMLDIENDILAGQLSLWKIVASADGLQLSNNPLYSAHHFANVMFNVMRGGIFADHYWVQAKDFIEFVSIRNRKVLQSNPAFFNALPTRIHITELQSWAEASHSTDLMRLSYAYLPLIFSRRHGDPSRPWNRFAINIKKPDGSPNLDYEGNWRDIFQNWEALAYSYPEFVESMISAFLNATTVDGYNPYRITQHGIDWENPEPGNPWANIGYWSDHQIIYLQKLMEISAKVHPGKLEELLTRRIFSCANVPYKIKPYPDLLKDPFNTIEFDWDLERQIETRQKEMGTDGKLVRAVNSQPGQAGVEIEHVLQVSLTEKLLMLLLAKMANFVPEGGIWMNTQRPEWNDANNALVGKGLSVVTLCYLRRTIVFCRELFSKSRSGGFLLSVEVQQFTGQVSKVLGQFQPILQGSFTDEQRRQMMDLLGEAGSDFRWNYYQHGLSGELVELPVKEIVAFLNLAQQFVEHSLCANRRVDRLYHAYNVLHISQKQASISYLYEMLEGQVAILSSGMLSGDESLALLNSLRSSPLYQSDQQSYILYPDRKLPGFLEKNCLTQDQVRGIMLFGMLIEAQDKSIITQDVNGVCHFSGVIRNFHDVDRALETLRKQPRYVQFVDAEFEKIKALFEETFHHDEFTGRSGTFFAFEGLGSVYWHMVSKLLLAAQEAAIWHRIEESAPALKERYEDIRQGLSFTKSPKVYGAFPTDPYSHTPKGQGAKQPGMSGMVKEEILTRQAELGFSIVDGRLVFDLILLDPHELLTAPAEFSYLNVNGHPQKIELKAGGLAYTICQTPVVLEENLMPGLDIHFEDGAIEHSEGNELDSANTRHIFQRDGRIHHLVVHC